MADDYPLLENFDWGVPACSIPPLLPSLLTGCASAALLSFTIEGRDGEPVKVNSLTLQHGHGCVSAVPGMFLTCFATIKVHKSHHSRHLHELIWTCTHEP